MGRKLPYGRVNEGDVLFFIENKSDGLVKAKAVVEKVFNSDRLSKEESVKMVNDNQNRLLLNDILIKRFGGRRYLVLISIQGFQEITAFTIDKSHYGNMDDWLQVGNIDSVKVN